MSCPPESPYLQDCWPVDWTCAQDARDEADKRSVVLAEGLAVQTLRMLTGFRVGGCPITVRPCNRSCIPGSWLTAPDVGALFAGVSGGAFGFSPYVGPNGAWLNACGCRGDGCSCTKVQEVILPGTATRIVEVVLDGVVMDETSYRVDNGNRLVRTDGGEWPVCQDMNADEGEGTFIVTYYDSVLVDEVGAYIAGTLAAEFLRACGGGDCALPANVQTVTRQGITMEMQPEIPEAMFPGGMTGIRIVDNWVRIWNPLATLPTGIYSPDAPPARRVTWRAGV